MGLLSLGVFVERVKAEGVDRIYDDNIWSTYHWFDDYTTIIVNDMALDSFVDNDIFGGKTVYTTNMVLEYKYETNTPPKYYNLVNVYFYIFGSVRPNENIILWMERKKRIVFFLDDSIRLSYIGTRVEDNHAVGQFHSLDMSVEDLKKIVNSNKIKFMFSGSFREYTLSEDVKEDIRKFYEVIEN